MNPATQDVFPDITVFGFGYTGEYEVPDTIEVGRGYWVFSPVARTVIIRCVPVDSVTIDLPVGFSLISPLREMDLPNDPNLAQQAWGYAGGDDYPAIRLAIGVAYWLAAFSPTTIELTK